MIGVPFGAWVGVAVLMLIPPALPALRHGRLRWSGLLLIAVAGIAIIVVGALPTISDLVGSVRVVSGFTEKGSALASDSGNLLQPIHAAQVLGVWLHGQYRVDPPSHLLLTYALIGVVLFAVVLGAARLLRRADWPLVIWITGVCLIWWILTVRGNVWTDYKLIVLTSPVALFLAWAGVGSLLGSGSPVNGVLLGAVIVAGVLGSNASQYHDTRLAPTGRFNELQTIAGDHVGGGPVLLNDFDEYGLYILRKSAPDLLGAAYKDAATVGLVPGLSAKYGRSFDSRRGLPGDLRGPPGARRAQEPGGEPAAERVPAGLPGTLVRRVEASRGGQAECAPHASGARTRRTRVASCAAVRSLARRDPAGTLVAAARPRTIVIDPVKADHSPTWPPIDDGLRLVTPGRVNQNFTTTRPAAGGCGSRATSPGP